jgi:hypothetical protein
VVSCWAEVLRGALLLERDHGRRAGDDEADQQRTRRHQQPPPGAALLRRALLALAVGERRTGVEELALERVHVVRVEELVRLGQAGAAVQRAIVALQALPLAGRVGQLPVQAQAGAVGVDPVAQPRPGADQRLVRHVDELLAAVAGGGQQPGGDELIQHRRDALPRQLADRRPPARVLGALARLGEAQQGPPGQLLLGRREPGDQLLRALGQRAAHAARLAVALEREHRPAAALPQLQQRVLQQRQRTRLGAGVLEDGVDQPLLELQPDPARRLLDRLAHRVAAHRADEHLPATDQLRELPVGRAALVEVRAHRHHDDARPAGRRRGVDQVREQGPPLGVVRAQREHLLELVDHQHDPLLGGVRAHHLDECEMQGPRVRTQTVERRRHRPARRQRGRERGERRRPRPEDARAPVAAERAAQQRRQQPGADQR